MCEDADILKVPPAWLPGSCGNAQSCLAGGTFRSSLTNQNDGFRLRRGKVTPAILARIDRQSEQASELASRLDPRDDRTREALDAEALAAVPLQPDAAATGIIAESLDACAALLELFSSEEDAATEETLAEEGLTPPDADDHEALEAWDAEIHGRTTAVWLSLLALEWDDREP